jgi:hypothetical protein
LENQGDPNSSVLIMREPVTAKAAAVWAHRQDTDLYSGTRKQATQKPQVDHILECQLTEMALARTFQSGRQTRLKSMATAQATEWLRDVVNGLGNLNVTSAKINQAKRGPFTAALNRLQSGQLRTVSIEQMARQGRGRWMLEDGTWPRIETAIVASFDELQSCEVKALPAAQEVITESIEELHILLGNLGVL